MNAPDDCELGMIAEGVCGASASITPRLRLMNWTRTWEWVIELNDRLEKIAPHKKLLMSPIKLFPIFISPTVRRRYRAGRAWTGARII